MMFDRFRLFAPISILLISLLSMEARGQALPDPAQEARAKALSKQLRCVVCQNQSIDDSTAPLAMDLKVLLRERIAAGDSDAAAKAFLVQRYGNFVLLKPPLQLNTIMLWLGPFLLLLAALYAAYRFVAGRSEAVAMHTTAGDAEAVALTPDEERRLAAALTEKAL